MGLFSMPKAKPKEPPKEKLYRIKIEPVRESEIRQENVEEVENEQNS